MNSLQDFWNKNTARIPDGKGEALYAAEKERLFPRSSAVCDLGGGTGTDSLYFASQGHRVTLVDIADDALTRGETKAKEQGLETKIETVQCDLSLGMLPPLTDETFDIMYSRLALHYFESAILTQIFAEIYRVLRSGGTAYLTLKSPDDEAEMAFLNTTATQIEDGVFDEDGRIKTRYTIDRLKEILTAANIPTTMCTVASYTERLGNKNDVVKSGNSEFIVNEITIQK